MTKYLSKSIAILVLISFVSACKTVPLPSETIGEHGFKKALVKGDDFVITTYQKITDPNKPYIFYIEGDGAAFLGKYRISTNPTPRKQMLLKLVAQDERPNVVYIARPCQYTPMELNPKCNNQYWTSKRMSEDSVQSLNEVINKLNGQHKFSLIGFSGGGSMVVLIAARNNMTKDILTISANLDHAAFTTLHNVSPMIDSLNPIEYVDKVKHIPQLHLSGGKDTVIPAFIAERFVQASDSSCVKQKIYEDASHSDGWEVMWTHILSTEQIDCQKQATSLTPPRSNLTTPSFDVKMGNM